ncbi:MAG: HisA/HisF-related TIM barrel protein [Endomicrobiia bacterium]
MIKTINAKIDKMIISTLIIYHPELVREIVKTFPDRIIASVDVLNEKIAIGGWKEITEINAIDLIKKIKDIGIKEIILTDITKDGTLEGPNIEEIKKIAKSCDINICVSGGIGTKEDILKLKELEKFGVKSIIIGKALYDETINLEEVLKLVE